MANNINVDDLWAFSIAANAPSLRQAAELLHISQPPLSRKIKNLETSLGVELFVRHNNGLELSAEGREVLEIIRPLLDMRNHVQRRLEMLGKAKPCVIGLSTAFEQGVYEPAIKFAKFMHGEKIAIKRAPSTHLAYEVAKGNIMAAWVALPMPKSDLPIINLHYAEQMVAVVPEQWANIPDTINLPDLNDRYFFWFPASRNPYWHEQMKSIFNTIGFKPKILEEPLEHDVLLGRIANGEAFAIMPQSFTAIQRRGIKFIKVRDIPPLSMGIVFQGGEGEVLAQNFVKNNSLGKFSL